MVIGYDGKLKLLLLQVTTGKKVLTTIPLNMIMGQLFFSLRKFMY